METTTRIVFIDKPNKAIPEELKGQDGSVSIIVSGDDVRLNIKPRDISRYEKLISDYTNTFEQILDKADQEKLDFVHHRTSSTGVAKYRGYLMSDSIKIIDGYVLVTKTSELPTSGKVKYSIQIIGTHQLWKEKSKEIPVGDLIIEQELFTWNEANILDLWQNNSEYTDGGKTFYPLLANFGKYHTNIYSGLGELSEPETQEVSLQDIRIINYLNPIVKAGFNAMGYSLESEYIDSRRFRKEAGYHMAENYASLSIHTYNKLFKASGTGTDLISNGDLEQTILTIDDDSTGENYDVGGIYRGATGDHPYSFINDTKGTVRYKFYYKCRFENFNLGSGGGVNAKIYLDAVYGKDASTDPDDIYELPIKSIDVISGGVGILEGSFEINVPAGYFISLSFWSSAIDDSTQYTATRFLDGQWSNERKSEVYLDGDIIDVNRSIDPELTLNDILFDLSVMANLAFETNEDQKKVTAEPDTQIYKIYDIDLNDFVQVRGFLKLPRDKDGVIDLTKNIDIGKYITKDFKQQANPESYLFKFKDHTDEYEKYDEYKEEEPPLAKLIKIEGGTAPQIKVECKNYEPTLNDYDEALKIGNSAAPYIPFIWGNERENTGAAPEPSNKVGYRIFCVLGWVEQYPEMAGQKAKFKFIDTEHEAIPTVFQEYPNYWAEIGGNIQKTDLNNIFGSLTQKNDLVTTCYGRFISQELEGIIISFEGQMSNLELQNFSPRKIAKILFENRDLERFNGVHKIIELNKYVGSNKMTAKLSPINPEEEQIYIVEPEEQCDHESILLGATLWIDAFDISGDGSATTDGTEILNWKDKSDNQNHLAQIGSQTGPVKETASAGRPVVAFTSDQLQSFKDTGSTSFISGYIVARVNGADGYTLSFDTATGVWGLIIRDGSDNINFDIGPGSPIQEQWGGTVGAFHIWGFKIGRWSAGNPTQAAFRRDGAEVGTAGGGNNISAAEKIVLGRGPTAGDYAQIDIAEMVIFKRILEDEEQSCIEEYLSNKWSIPLQ